VRLNGVQVRLIVVVDVQLSHRGLRAGRPQLVLPIVVIETRLGRCVYHHVLALPNSLHARAGHVLVLSMVVRRRHGLRSGASLRCAFDDVSRLEVVRHPGRRLVRLATSLDLGKELPEIRGVQDLLAVHLVLVARVTILLWNLLVVHLLSGIWLE